MEPKIVEKNIVITTLVLEEYLYKFCDSLKKRKAF